MNRTVDLVIFCDRAGPSAFRRMCPAVADAIHRGRRILVVLRSGDRRVRTRLRQCLAPAAVARGQLSIVSNADIVCVDGVERVEAVVLRYRKTGRVLAVNASEFEAILTAPTA